MATKKRKTTSTPKQVVYLWGAGATQGEIDYLGAYPVNLLMRDNQELGEGIATRILNRLNKKWHSTLTIDGGPDIEKLISLLVGSGAPELTELAEKIRRHYFTVIRNGLAQAKIISRPQLAIGLLKMHRNEHFQESAETLTGILTTNHDGLLQIAAQEVYEEVNLGIPFASADIQYRFATSTPPILNLHGSFTWKFSIPLEVGRLKPNTAYSSETVWIPPTILKESKAYPFNKLAGVAYELLSKHCDILRVVGSSLTQNDWNVLSMIFNAQLHRELTGGSAFRIEIISSPDTGERVKKNCSFLKNLTPIEQLTEGQLSHYKEDTYRSDTEMKNALAYWMKEKINHHYRHGDFGSDPIDPAMAKIAGETP